MMPFGARLGFVLLSAPAWAFSIGLLLELSWATSVWPGAESRLTYVFIASVAGAVAAPIMWIGLSREIAAARGEAIHLIIDGFFTVFFVWKGLAQDDLRLVAYGVGSGLATVAITPRRGIRDPNRCAILGLASIRSGLTQSGPATWDGHPRCLPANGGDAVGAIGPGKMCSTRKPLLP
jgi:hypothetical protein